MCVMAVVGAAPCQCFSPGGNQTISPGRIPSTVPPSRCARPQPAVTIKAWPNGCVCHAVRAPGSNVTVAADARAGGVASNSGSMRTVPVNQSSGPFLDSCEPTFLISIFHPFIEPTLPLTCGETDKQPNRQYNSYMAASLPGRTQGAKPKLLSGREALVTSKISAFR
jgi:hypothetical protein